MKNWPWVLLLHALFLQLAAYIVRPAAAYRALQLGVDPALLGLVAASFAVVPLFVAVLVGRAADTGREFPVLLAGAVIMVASGVGLLLFASSLALLLGWNVLLGLGHLMCVVGQQSRVARNPPGTLDSAFGLYTFAGSAGQAVGPVLIAFSGGGRVLPDTDALFGIYTAAATTMLVLTAFLVRGSTGSRGTRTATGDDSQRLLRDTTPDTRRQLFGSLALSMMLVGALDLLAVYLPALGVERGIPAAAVGFLLSIRALATMASRLYLGKLVTLLGRSELITASTALAALTVGALTVPMPVWSMTLVLVLVGVGLGIGQPLTMTVISLAAPLGTRGRWLALRLSANRLGQSAIPAGVGMVAAAAGATGVFAAMAAALAVVSGTSMITLRKQQR